VDGVVPVDLGQRQLVVDAVLGVAAVTDPVRPRDELLATAARAGLVRVEAGEHLDPVACPRAQSAANLDDDELVSADREVPLLAGG
jgi:hypothetical protein